MPETKTPHTSEDQNQPPKGEVPIAAETKVADTAADKVDVKVGKRQ